MDVEPLLQHLRDEGSLPILVVCRHGVSVTWQVGSVMRMRKAPSVKAALDMVLVDVQAPEQRSLFEGDAQC